MKPEDAAEIKFMAEKASSVAKLTVKGWLFIVNMVCVDYCMHFFFLSLIQSVVLMLQFVV